MDTLFVIGDRGAPNKPLQPTRAAQPNEERETDEQRPARLSAGVGQQHDDEGRFR
jgi:hypothetical protein